MTSANPEKNNNFDSDPINDISANDRENHNELSTNPDYHHLIELYQKAEFNKCKEYLDTLQKQYPENSVLKSFNDDLQLKLSLKTMADSIEEVEKHKKKKAIFKMSAFAIISTIVVVIAFVLSFIYLNQRYSIRQQEIENAQLSSLFNQSEQLLLAGQPQRAKEINARIQEINPEFENLQDLINRTENLLNLEAKYNEALKMISEKKNSEALTLLKEINTELPGLWDVSQQIALLENALQVELFIEAGNLAFENGNWDVVIDSYENAFKLDPEINDPIIKEQLLKGYLNKVISMLDRENNSIEDIENAEEYYRRAVSMTPQSKAFASERGNLQKVISDLLEQKFIQIAIASLEDENQTATSINKAVSYIRKAANINPENTYLQADLKNAENYQVAFNSFVEMKWGQAITNLELITAADKNYANGNANLLLFEAYYALGKQYSSLGLYLDAFKTLEKAEILAWDDSENLMKLFQIQKFLGDTSGKIGDFENAVSYYQYALNAIKINQRLTNYSTMASKLSEANVLAAYSKYEEAYTAFQELFEEIDVIYTAQEKEIGDGACLVFFASKNLSSVNVIMEANNLPNNMIVTFKRSLIVPIIEK